MKINYLVIHALLFLSIQLQAQIKSGNITYKVNKSEIDIKNTKDPRYKAFANEMISIGQKLEFELKFSQGTSRFEIIQELALDKDDLNTKMAIAIMRGNNIFFTDIEKNVFIEQKKTFNELILVEKSLDSIHWNLTEETKKIDGYSCYKATGIKKGSGKNFKETKTLMTAWYCPELSFPFGPFEAVGLPGLVLDFTLGNFTFTANKMTFDEKTKKIIAPNKGRKISEEQLNKVIRERVSDKEGK